MVSEQWWFFNIHCDTNHLKDMKLTWHRQGLNSRSHDQASSTLPAELTNRLGYLLKVFALLLFNVPFKIILLIRKGQKGCKFWSCTRPFWPFSSEGSWNDVLHSLVTRDLGFYCLSPNDKKQTWHQRDSNPILHDQESRTLPTESPGRPVILSEDTCPKEWASCLESRKNHFRDDVFHFKKKNISKSWK